MRRIAIESPGRASWTAPRNVRDTIVGAETWLRPRVAIALDWLALTLAVAAVLMAWTGGFYTEIGGIRLSSRNPDRALIPAAIALAIRWWWGGAVRPFGVERQPMAGVAGAAVPAGRRSSSTCLAWPWWTRAALATLGILVVGAVLLRPQLQHMDAVPGLWRSAVFDVANGLGLRAVARRSTAALQRQHLLSAAARAHVLRLDARAVG